MAIHLRALTWNDPRGYGPMRPLAEAFARTPEGRGVTVEWSVQPLAGFETSSVIEHAESYDVMIIDHPHVIEAATAGAIAPIEMYGNDEFIGPCLASYCWQGRQWAVPVDAASHVTAYRPDRIDGPPTTWGRLFEQAAAEVRFGIPLRGVHSLMALLTLTASMGAPFDAQLAEREPGAGVPGDAELLCAVQVLQQIASVCIPESLDWNPLEALAGLAEGICDCVPLTFGYAHFQDRGVRFGPIPAVDIRQVARPLLGGTGMAVSARRSHVETARALAQFAGSEEVQAELWPRHDGQPARREAWQRLRATDPFYRDTFSSMATAYLRPRCIGWNEFQCAAGDAITEWLGARLGSPQSLVERLRQLWYRATCAPVCSQLVTVAATHDFRNSTHDTDATAQGEEETVMTAAPEPVELVGDTFAVPRCRAIEKDGGLLS